MFIIWGSRTIEKNLGHSQETYMCRHCNNASNYKIFHRTKWFTLFWIPIIPLGRKYFVACPICNYGNELPKSTAMAHVQS